MAILYTVIYTTKNGKTHSYPFPHWYSGNLFEQACEMNAQNKERDSVVSGFVYDEVNKRTFGSFDKSEVV